MNPPPLPVRKRFAWIPYWIVLALIVLVALAPIGSVITCGWIANAHGCKVDEGSVHPCMINGKDYGQLLYTSWRPRLADACHSSRWGACFRDLVGRSHSSSGKLAEAHWTKYRKSRRACVKNLVNKIE